MSMKKTISPFFLPVFVLIVYMILYAPIIVLILFSFNDEPLALKWTGFSLKWYFDLFESVEIFAALKNSLIVAFSAVVLSITLGLFYVFYGAYNFLNKLIILFYGNLIVPEIVLAVGLLSLFSFFAVPLGLTTLIAGHTILGLGYVVPLLQTSFLEIDYRLIEASLDLGATQSQTFFRIIIPLLYPVLISAALLVIVISLDDFLISFFCVGATTVTLPIYIFSTIRAGATPVVNALSTLILLIISVLILVLTSTKTRVRTF